MIEGSDKTTLSYGPSNAYYPPHDVLSRDWTHSSTSSDEVDVFMECIGEQVQEPSGVPTIPLTAHIIDTTNLSVSTTPSGFVNSMQISVDEDKSGVSNEILIFIKQHMILIIVGMIGLLVVCLPFFCICICCMKRSRKSAAGGTPITKVASPDPVIAVQRDESREEGNHWRKQIRSPELMSVVSNSLPMADPEAQNGSLAIQLEEDGGDQSVEEMYDIGPTTLGGP